MYVVIKNTIGLTLVIIEGINLCSLAELYAALIIISNLFAACYRLVEQQCIMQLKKETRMLLNY